MIAGTGDASNTHFFGGGCSCDGCILAVYNVYDGWWGDDDTWVVVEDEDGRQWAPAEPPTASHYSQ